MMVESVELIEEVIDFDWDFKKSKSDLIHSIHPYPAKFIADIPKTLLSKFPLPKNSLVFDPFCGSGVTLLESQRAGLESLGVDLNPIACLISRVKVNKLDFDIIKESDRIIEKVKQTKGRVTIPKIPNVDHWFKKEIQKALTLLINEINKVRDPGKLDALKFCVSSIIVKVSNQDSDTRYASVENNHSFDDVLRFFKEASQKLAKAKSAERNTSESTILNKSSLLLHRSDFPKKIGMVITSPPYPNAYEYWLYHKYRMWWLGYDPLNVKEQEIGARAHYFKKNHQTEKEFIDQMDSLLKSLYQNSVKSAYMIFVIGRSKIHGRIIENDEIIKEKGLKNGFNHVATVERNINMSRKSFNLSHARIKQEYLVILQKP